MGKNYVMKIPVTIQEEDGPASVSTHFEIRAVVPVGATVSDVLEAFAFQFTEAMKLVSGSK